MIIGEANQFSNQGYIPFYIIIAPQHRIVQEIFNAGFILQYRAVIFRVKRIHQCVADFTDGRLIHFLKSLKLIGIAEDIRVHRVPNGFGWSIFRLFQLDNGTGIKASISFTVSQQRPQGSPRRTTVPKPWKTASAAASGPVLEKILRPRNVSL